jgi:hypothetical protein
LIGINAAAHGGAHSALCTLPTPNPFRPTPANAHSAGQAGQPATEGRQEAASLPPGALFMVLIVRFGDPEGVSAFR